MVTRTKKIFVGGLSASTVQADLTAYFSKYGKVRILISQSWYLLISDWLSNLKSE